MIAPAPSIPLLLGMREGYPSNTRPHYLERLGPEDGVFIRVGSTNRKAEAIRIEELKRLNWRTTFDEQAIPDLKSEATDFRAASELFAPSCAYRRPQRNPTCGSLSTAELVPLFAATDTVERCPDL